MLKAVLFDYGKTLVEGAKVTYEAREGQKGPEATGVTPV